MPILVPIRRLAFACWELVVVPIQRLATNRPLDWVAHPRLLCVGVPLSYHVSLCHGQLVVSKGKSQQSHWVIGTNDHIFIACPLRGILAWSKRSTLSPSSFNSFVSFHWNNLIPLKIKIFSVCQYKCILKCGSSFVVTWTNPKLPTKSNPIESNCDPIEFAILIIWYYHFQEWFILYKKYVARVVHSVVTLIDTHT